MRSKFTVRRGAPVREDVRAIVPENLPRQAQKFGPVRTIAVTDRGRGRGGWSSSVESWGVILNDRNSEGFRTPAPDR